MCTILSLKAYKVDLKFHKTAVLNSFLRFYVMGSTEIDLFGIAHVKVEDKPVLKIYAISILGRFVWSTYFVQCGILNESQFNKYP